MLRRLVLATAKTPKGARQGRIAASACIVLSVILGAIFAAYFAGRPGFGTATATALFLASIAGGVALGQVFYELDGLFDQQTRDLRAMDIKADLDAGRIPDEPFTLYLRPFASTNTIARDDSRFVNVAAGAPGIAPQYVMASDRIEFETQIETALRPLGTLVGLGRPLEHFGAGRIVVAFEGWQDLIAKLMDHARLIVLLPSSRGGTSWEVERILERGLLPKTIIVDPPNAAGAARKDYDPSAEWDSIRSAFSTHGRILPPDDENGLLLWFGDSDMPQKLETAPLGNPRAIRRFATDILDTIDSGDASIAAIAPA
ncbi:MAG: hypothetical protein AAFQ21_07235 [Pseudomonadota bacterium]